ncbi:MAG: MFS transporter, partial [Proteobacteria bacterium]
LSILLPSVGFAGFFAWISYIAPLLTVEAKLPENAVPLLMVIAGLGMTVGNLWGGKLADKYSPLKAIIFLMLVLTGVLCLNGIFAASPVALILLTFVTGAVALAMCAPIQVLLISNAKEAEMLGASLGQASFNIGNALGAALGGIPLTLGYSFASPQWVGAGMSFTGAVIGGLIYLFFADQRAPTARVNAPV